jgi:hypothetical protein
MVFNSNHLNKLDFGTHPWWFECDLRHTFEDIDHFERNVDIERLLVASNVVPEDAQPDSETSAFVCNFRTREQGNDFINRLNKFIGGSK